jgi:flavin reductase (DIM6/NTAB) family NADH-FMN oxidoreductase RutF
MPGEIHDEHPFAQPEADRDPIRRFRGRLSAPVTIITAGSEAQPVGLTVSSIIVGGDAASGRVHFVLGPESYVWDVIQETGRFVVHVLDETQRALADSFAGVRPSPGGPFRGLAVADSPHGPVLTDCATRAACVFDDVLEHDDYLLVSGTIEAVELEALSNPLQWFRGAYGPQSRP